MEKKVIFHGACHNCQSQTLYKRSRCVGCKYFGFDLNLPDLSTNEDEKILDKIRAQFCLEHIDEYGIPTGEMLEAVNRLRADIKK